MPKLKMSSDVTTESPGENCDRPPVPPLITLVNTFRIFCSVASKISCSHFQDRRRNLGKLSYCLWGENCGFALISHIRWWWVTTPKMTVVHGMLVGFLLLWPRGSGRVQVQVWVSRTCMRKDFKTYQFFSELGFLLLAQAGFEPMTPWWWLPKG